LTIKERKVIL